MFLAKPVNIITLIQRLQPNLRLGGLSHTEISLRSLESEWLSLKLVSQWEEPFLYIQYFVIDGRVVV